MLSRHGGDWVERLWFKSKLSEFCQICTNMYKKINCRLIFPFLSNTIQLYSFSVSSWLPFQYWCPLYNIQPPSLPSQIERSPSFAYLHYRDNPLVRRPICASPWLVLFESWNLVEIPFCLKVEITEISKPFICQRLAGESQTAKSFNCSSLKTRKRQRENNYLLKFADIVEISGLRHEWMGMIACDLVCDKCDKCELTNTMMAGGRWNHFPVDCGTRQTRVAAQFIFCCPNATSNRKIQNSWGWRISNGLFCKQLQPFQIILTVHHMTHWLHMFMWHPIVRAIIMMRSGKTKKWVFSALLGHQKAWFTSPSSPGKIYLTSPLLPFVIFIIVILYWSSMMILSLWCLGQRSLWRWWWWWWWRLWWWWWWWWRWWWWWWWLTWLRLARPPASESPHRSYRAPAFYHNVIFIGVFVMTRW